MRLIIVLFKDGQGSVDLMMDSFSTLRRRRDVCNKWIITGRSGKVGEDVVVLVRTLLWWSWVQSAHSPLSLDQNIVQVSRR